MQNKKRKVLLIDSEPSILEQQKKLLRNKELDEHLYSFMNLSEAMIFIEAHIINNKNKLHYIILDEKAVGNQLSRNLEKFWGINSFLKKPDIIVITEDNNALIRNRIMQYPFVSVFLVKPMPSSYIEFLITGQLS